MKNEIRGTTIPELLVVMGIMGILLVLAQKVIVFGYEFYRSTDQSVTLQKEALLALTWLGQDASVSHHRSLWVEIDPSVQMVVEPFDYQEDKLLLPLPRKVDGDPIINDDGALTWASIAGYEIDTVNHRLMRYLVDSIDVPAPNKFRTGNPPPNDYEANIEYVPVMPLVSTLTTYPSLNARVVAREVVALVCTKQVDTLDIELTILLPGRVAGAQSLDHSLTLQTTVFPKN